MPGTPRAGTRRSIQARCMTPMMAGRSDSSDRRGGSETASTMLLVTADHGGHGTSMATWCRAISRFRGSRRARAWRVNREIKSPVSIAQTAPTIAPWLGIAPHECWVARPVAAALSEVRDQRWVGEGWSRRAARAPALARSFEPARALRKPWRDSRFGQRTGLVQDDDVAAAVARAALGRVVGFDGRSVRVSSDGDPLTRNIVLLGEQSRAGRCCARRTTPSYCGSGRCEWAPNRYDLQPHRIREFLMASATLAMLGYASCRDHVLARGKQ